MHVIVGGWLVFVMMRVLCVGCVSPRLLVRVMVPVVQVAFSRFNCVAIFSVACCIKITREIFLKQAL